MEKRDYSFITDELREQIKGFVFDNRMQNAGRLVACGDGVLTIEGLTDVKNGELIYINGGKYALAMNLEERRVGAILLGDADDLSGGDLAYSTGRIVSVPVGEALLGRVVDALGSPLDGKSKPVCNEYRNIESPAPSIFERSKVNEPLYTGIKAIDSMIPIGKGQRELIIGDRQTGKTAIAVDTILNQKGKDVICIYVAIGQKASGVAKLINILNERGAMEYTVVVAATASSDAPIQYLAPYTGTAIAEYFAYNGKDVLIVYDDLTKHAVAYRALSLLLRRPSGREAYPGDIFYLHSRLLERSAKLSKEKGGGSITALPIIETLSGDISAYIPTNVISITDGQIYLEEGLFNSGVRPAINVGLSVSRVGGSAQEKAMRKVSGKTRLDLAHYREMVLFSRFGSDIDAATKAVIDKGERLTEAIKQPQYAPVSMTDTVITLFISMNDLLKNIPVREVTDYIKGFLNYFHLKHGKAVDEIASSGNLTDENEKEILAAVKEYEQRIK